VITNNNKNNNIPIAITVGTEGVRKK